MSAPKAGKVWLVGAGPGDAGLLTLRGREVLEKADVVVYDRLIGPGLAGFFPPDAKLIYVGKRTGDHTVVQEEIEEILLREALPGKRVVRLKGGDPFLFGRGGEEALTLLSRGIDVEIVPGVTSAVSVPACAGIPITHRGLSKGLYVITAHHANDEIPLDYDLPARVDDTLAILMGAGRISEIADGLIASGKSPSTPAAIIQNGTTARMKKISGPLADIGELARQSGIDAPAIIVVGDVCTLSDRLDRRGSRSLANTRVWLTGANEECDFGGRLGFLLRDAGAEVAHLPCIATVSTGADLPPEDEMRGLDWLVFSSRTGVTSFFEALDRADLDIRSIGDARIAAVGPSTARFLETRGLRVDYVPQVHDGENLARGLTETFPLAGTRVLLVRCAGAMPGWSGILRESGAAVAQAGLYETRPLASPILEQIAPGDVVVFKSASAARVCAEAVRCDKSTVRAVCIGKPSALSATRHGFSVVAAPRTDDEALFETLVENFGNKGGK